MNRKRFYVVYVVTAVLIFSSYVIYPQGSIKIYPRPDQVKGDLSRHFVQETNQTSDKDMVAEISSDIKIEPVKKSSYNYFRVDKSGRSLWNGKHWRPSDYPLTVYVKTTSSDYYKKLFRTYIDYAFSTWEKADKRIKFKYASNTRDADIIIMFDENLIMKYDDNYLGITDYRLDSNKKIMKSFIEIGLLKFNREPVSDGEIKATIIHELGHALGLGHSNSESDIMFPFIDPFSSSEMNFNELSGADIEAVRSVVSLGFGFSLN